MYNDFARRYTLCEGPPERIGTWGTGPHQAFPGIEVNILMLFKITCIITTIKISNDPSALQRINSHRAKIIVGPRLYSSK